jgi:arsenate reductase
VSPILDPMEHAPVEMRPVIEHGTSRLSEEFNVIVTMGGEVPIPHGKRHEEWELPDAAGQDLDGVRKIRDDIGDRVHTLLAGLGVRPAS